MTRVPTDLTILTAIYEQYYESFASFRPESPCRQTKVYVPVDLQRLASDLGIDGDIVFGRLYYHLGPKHGFRQDDGTRVPFFELEVRDPKNTGLRPDRHCIHFPLLAAVLASMKVDSRKFWVATTIATGSLIVAVAALAVSVTNMFFSKSNIRADLDVKQVAASKMPVEGDAAQAAIRPLSPFPSPSR